MVCVGFTLLQAAQPRQLARAGVLALLLVKRVKGCVGACPSVHTAVSRVPGLAG